MEVRFRESFVGKSLNYVPGFLLYPQEIQNSLKTKSKINTFICISLSTMRGLDRPKGEKYLLDMFQNLLLFLIKGYRLRLPDGEFIVVNLLLLLLFSLASYSSVPFP